MRSVQTSDTPVPAQVEPVIYYVVPSPGMIMRFGRKGHSIIPPGGGKADIVYASTHGSAQANRSVITVGTI